MNDARGNYFAIGLIVYMKHSMMSGDLICEGLEVRRGWRRVFSGMSFNVPAGGALMLRGPNGSGKSTLLKALAGFVPIREGDATYSGCSIRNDRAAFIDMIAYAGHLDALKPSLTAAELLQFHADITLMDRARVPEALSRMGLEQLANEPVRIMSAGQKRRLGLARLALTDRPLWLLDEPTVSLDQESAGRVVDLLASHCAKGGSVLVATHIDMALPNASVLDPSDFGTPKAAEQSNTQLETLTGESW